MKVQDVMTKDVKTCKVDADLSMAARTMWMRDCGVLPVVNDEGEVVGILTDRDICIAAGSKNHEPSSIPVSEVITRRVHTCSPGADIHEALEIMRANQVRRLPVVDEQGKLCGILSLNDVAIKAREVRDSTELSAEDVENTLEAICRRRSAPQDEPERRAAA
jgi:CBS domain-containing protein